MAKILIIEDDLMVAQMVLDWLEAQHHLGESVHTGDDGWDRLRFYSYDLVIVDWMLPGLSGVELCRKYRSAGGTIPILMLTGKNKIENKEEGFESGADDYLTKPFDIRELGVRVQALLRRPSEIVKPLAGLGQLVLDYKRYALVRDGETIKLLPKEFALLEFLLRHPGRFFTPEQILNHVWQSDSDTTVDSLRTCIKRLRQRIEREGKPSLIQSSRGFGYKLEMPGSDSEGCESAEPATNASHGDNGQV
jgi:OmpR-family two-component system manganese-sensing response regulator